MSIHARLLWSLLVIASLVAATADAAEKKATTVTGKISKVLPDEDDDDKKPEYVVKTDDCDYVLKGPRLSEIVKAFEKNPKATFEVQGSLGGDEDDDERPLTVRSFKIVPEKKQEDDEE